MRVRRKCRPFRALTPTGWAVVAFVLAAAWVGAQIEWSALP